MLSGLTVIHGVPAGGQTLKVWRPYLRAPASTLAQPVQIPRDGVVEVAVTGDVRAPPERHQAY